MKKSNTSRLTQFGFTPRLPLLSWRGIFYLWVPLLALLVGGILISQRLIHPAPTTIRILSGPDGSSYRNNAEKYKKIKEKKKKKVNSVGGEGVFFSPPPGALHNLQQLVNPKVKADVAFVQGG